MSVAINPENLKRFQAYRHVLGVMENNGQDKKASHDDVIEFLFSHSPIKSEVEDYMKQAEKLTKKLSEQREGLLLKGEVQKA